MTYEAKRDDKDAMEKELGYKIHEWNEIYADPKHRNLIKKKKGLLEQDTSIHSVTDVRIYDDVILSKDRYIAGDPDLHIRTIRTIFMNGGSFDDNNKPTEFRGYGSGYRNRVWYTDLKLFRKDKPFK